MAVNLNLEMKLLNVVIAYLDGNLDMYVYMKVPEGILVPNQNRARYSVERSHCID